MIKLVYITTGIYGFKYGSDFVKYAEQMIKQNIRTNKEFFNCPVYNLLIQDGKDIQGYKVNAMHSLGTPEDVKAFETIQL